MSPLQERFNQAFLSANGFHTKAELAREWQEGMLSSHMFRAGAVAQLTLEVPTWITTADQLPPLDQEVLAVYNGVRGVGCRYSRHDGGHGYTFNNCSQAGDRFKFSHWQPLPPLPGGG